MPRLSCFTPCGHLRCSSAASAVEVWYRLLPDLWGKQLDFSQLGSYNESKLYAWARMLAIVQGELEHAGNQANPHKAYEQIPLLELDYGIIPPAKAGVAARRRALVAAYLATQGEIASNVVNTLRTLLGSKFLAYVPNPAGTPTVEPPDPRSVTSGQWADVRIPPRYIRLIDPVGPGLSPQWVAYEALDTSALPTTTWSDEAEFSIGQTVLPTAENAVGFYFTCSGPGTTGTTEPAWVGTLGATVTDGTVTWTCTAPVAPGLVIGESVMVDAGNTSQHERVVVESVATTESVAVNASQGPYLYMLATFTKSHDSGALATTGVYPYWWSTQRLAYIVLADAWSSDPTTVAAIGAALGKIVRAVGQWAVVAPKTTTASGGTVGAMVVGDPMGTTSIGSVSYSNSV